MNTVKDNPKTFSASSDDIPRTITSVITWSSATSEITSVHVSSLLPMEQMATRAFVMPIRFPGDFD